MTELGALRDTYAAALQHDLIELKGDERLIGVVRRPLPWLLGQVEENRPELGPPPELLDAVKQRHEALHETGLSDAKAHNRALAELDYRDRYLDYVTNSEDAQAAIRNINALRADGQDVVLVCYENTADKRCHRTVLKAYIAERSEGR
ncbi:DUF488 family protein, N3 subclade [Halodesulfurarchaeum sp.]|uniref:DUF488 family protein, N3 subclade n=1 Tax=Halodesulfurarchaeum sp. TaxID=1980530 RepID=UPI001BC4D522|nr:DUF488 family protein [Halodesulfurarchaeum sp.]